VFEDYEAGVVLCTHHEWEEAGVGHTAPVLATNVDKDGAFIVPVLLAGPETLLIDAVIQKVEVINLLLEFLLRELGQIDLGPVLFSRNEC